MKLSFKNLFCKREHDESGDSASDVNAAPLTPSVEELLSNAEQISSAVSSCIEEDRIGEIGDRLPPLGSSEPQMRIFYHRSRFAFVLLIVGAALLSVGFGFALYIGVATLAFSSELASLGLGITLGAVAGLMLNIILIVRSVMSLKRDVRIGNYCDVLRLKRFVSIDELVAISDKSVKVVTQDLKYAVREQMLPQGHFGQDESLFMTSDEVFESYQLHSDAIDAWIIGSGEDGGEGDAAAAKALQARSDIDRLSEKIDGCVGLGKDKDFSAGILELKLITTLAAWEAGTDSQFAGSLNSFISSCLSTADCLLVYWLDIEQKRSVGQSVSSEHAQLIAALEKVIAAFEGLYSQLECCHEAVVIDGVEDLPCDE